MANDVRSALVQLMAAPSRLNSHDAAVKKLADMQLKGRYLQVANAAAHASPACAPQLQRRVRFSATRVILGSHVY